MNKVAIGVMILLTLAACGGGGGGGSGGASTVGTTPTTALSLTSTAFSNGSSIPNAYRCVSKGGAGNLPPLAWSSLPSGTKSLVIIMDDTDAAAVQGTTYTHYLAVIPFQAQVNLISSIDSVVNPSLPYENLTTVAGNNWIVLADLPPCNPQTTAHTYRWTIYALNAEYASIPALESQFNPIISGALNSTTVVENLNSYTVNGSVVQANPKITRSAFESAYGGYIIEKSTLAGTM